MALKNYILNGPSTVILADNRDPFVSWQNHLNRTSGLRGGIDLVAPIGTPVYAPTAGTWRWLPSNGSAGNSGEFGHDANPGWRDVFSHLSRYVGWSGKHFEQGEVIAYTGNTGGVDQHLHRHLLDPQGKRQNPWDYFSGASLSGTNPTPIDTSPKEDPPMARYIRNSTNGTIALANIDTGLWYNLSDPALVPLFDARGLWDRSKDLNVPNNEFTTFEAIAAMARGTASVTVVNDAAAQIDAAAVAKAVAEDLAARLQS